MVLEAGKAPNGFAPPPHRLPFGIIPNEPQQKTRGFVDFGAYSLAVVEFDDQGCCYDDRKQLRAVADRLEQLIAAATDVILVTYVHGWKHKTSEDDSNFVAFNGILAKIADKERQSGGNSPRPVLGIFVGWRGLTLFGGGLQNLTFWDRQQAGRRVATGSVRELFGYLRTYRNSRLSVAGSAPLVAIIGHSFGGMIVYSALAQSLLESAGTAASEVVPGFADLVLIVNPAIEATRYLPIYCVIQERLHPVEQLPVFVCVTARNDYATRYAFPLGNICSLFTESTRGRLERDCLLNTIGHVAALRTHRLSSPQSGSTFELSENSRIKQANPFWVVSATPEVINQHNGFLQPPFRAFVAGLLFTHCKESKKRQTRPPAIDRERPARPEALPQPPGELVSGNPTLQEMAEEMGPIAIRGSKPSILQ